MSPLTALSAWRLRCIALWIGLVPSLADLCLHILFQDALIERRLRKAQTAPQSSSGDVPQVPPGQPQRAAALLCFQDTITADDVLQRLRLPDREFATAVVRALEVIRCGSRSTAHTPFHRCTLQCKPLSACLCTARLEHGLAATPTQQHLTTWTSLRLPESCPFPLLSHSWPLEIMR